MAVVPIAVTFHSKAQLNVNLMTVLSEVGITKDTEAVTLIHVPNYIHYDGVN